jgi:hypothetical protein
MPSLIGLPTFVLVLALLSGCDCGSPQAAADPVEEPIKAIPCAGEWKLELVEQTRSCPIDPLGLRFGLVERPAGGVSRLTAGCGPIGETCAMARSPARECFV